MLTKGDARSLDYGSCEPYSRPVIAHPPTPGSCGAPWYPILSLMPQANVEHQNGALQRFRPFEEGLLHRIS